MEQTMIILIIAVIIFAVIIFFVFKNKRDEEEMRWAAINAAETLMEDLEMFKDGRWEIPDDKSVNASIDNLEIILEYLKQ